jgi:hypothetical protein
VADRPCEVCKAYCFEEDGTVSRDPAGEPLKRYPGQKPPCASCPKISDEVRRASELAGRLPTPDDVDQAWTDQSREVWDHYRRSKAVAWNVPDAHDPIVQRHAAILAGYEEQTARADLARQIVTGLVGIGLRGAVS